MALQGFVFKTFSLRAFHECDIRCERELTCQSYNYVVRENSCELNNRTKEARPEHFRSDPARVYLRRLSNRVPLGSIPELPARSCQEIKSSEGKDTTSSKYWLDPTRNGTAVLVHCDMNLEVCGPVGVEDSNKIPDARMTASTYFNIDYYPYYGRLNENRGDGAWCAKKKEDRTDYIQVDMGAVHSVCAVATQGEKVQHDWTTSYKLQLSTDGVTWNSYRENNVEKVFAGNTDQTSVVKRSLSPNITARFVRFYPVTYYEWPCLRVEIFVLK